MNARLWLRGLICLAVTFGLATTSPAEDEASGELVQLVIDLLEDTDKDVRALGLEQVRSESKGQAATRQFAAQLQKLPADAQIGLLSALAGRGDNAARPAVLEVLDGSRDESVRVAAVGALGFLGEPADSRRLVELLAGESKAEKAAAKASLVRLRGESVAGMIAAEMKQAPPSLSVILLQVLATRRALDTIPDILRAAVSESPAVRTAAMAALGQLAGPDHIAGMIRGVLKAERGRERETAEKAVMFVCGRIENQEKRAEPLLAAMNELDESDRTALLPTLGRVGGPAARRTIETAITDADSKLHDVGIRALCNWPNALIAPRLSELVERDKHSSHRTMALRALIRIAPLPDERTDDQRLALLRQAMAMCSRDVERNLVLQRARAIRSPETLRFITPYMNRVRYAQQACQSVVELAHHRELRDANKADFERALDKVIQTSKDATVIDRANRYKKGQTWVRPKGG